MTPLSAPFRTRRVAGAAALLALCAVGIAVPARAEAPRLLSSPHMVLTDRSSHDLRFSMDGNGVPPSLTVEELRGPDGVLLAKDVTRSIPCVATPEGTAACTLVADPAQTAAPGRYRLKIRAISKAAAPAKGKKPQPPEAREIELVLERAAPAARIELPAELELPLTRPLLGAAVVPPPYKFKVFETGGAAALHAVSVPPTTLPAVTAKDRHGTVRSSGPVEVPAGGSATQSILLEGFDRVGTYQASIPIEADGKLIRNQPVRVIVTRDAWEYIGIGVGGALVLSMLMSWVQAGRSPHYMKGRIGTLIEQLENLRARHVEPLASERLEALLSSARKAQGDNQSGRANRQLDSIEEAYLQIRAEFAQREELCSRTLARLTDWIDNGRPTDLSSRTEATAIRSLLSMQRIEEAERRLQALCTRLNWSGNGSEYSINVLNVAGDKRTRALELLAPSGDEAKAYWTVDHEPVNADAGLRVEHRFVESRVYRLEAAPETTPRPFVAFKYVAISHPDPLVKKLAVPFIEGLLALLLTGAVAFTLLTTFLLERQVGTVDDGILTAFLSLGTCFAAHAYLSFHRWIVLR